MSSTSYEFDTDQPEDNNRPPCKSLGIAGPKPRLRILDVVVLIASFYCCAAAISAVHIPVIAWHLGLQYQLVVVGLMLSILNICLNYSVPFLMVLVEARFGRSTLQNYEAILRNSLFGPQTDVIWRLILLATMVLPLGLSVAYKLFSGGQNTLVRTSSVPVEYGLFAPPDMEKVGANIGVSLMYNATLPFIQGTSAEGNPRADPNFPVSPGAYGLNTLLISRTAAAALDIPSPEFASDVQANLQPQEFWHVHARVLATVTRQNGTVERYRNLDDEESIDFWNTYLEKEPTIGSLFDCHEVWIQNNKGGLDQTWMFMSILPRPNNNSGFASKANMFATWREPCEGTWAITRTSIQLVDGKCDDIGLATSLPTSYQNVFTNANFGLDVWYMPTLLEYLGPFSKYRNASDWLLPTMSVSIAGMMYSRITALSGPSSWHWNAEEDAAFPGFHYTAYGGFQTFNSTRPGLSHSEGLLVVLAIQPLFSLIVMALTWLLYSVPIDRNFGLVSILAGVEPTTLPRLRGASLSAKLDAKVRLGVSVHNHRSDLPNVHYTVDEEETLYRSRAKPGEVYH